MKIPKFSFGTNNPYWIRPLPTKTTEKPEMNNSATDHLESFRTFMRILGLGSIALQYYVFGPSLGLALTHAVLAYCVWFNREKPTR